MKKILNIIFFGLIVLGCSDNSDDSKDYQIVEKWKLIRVEYLNTNDMIETINYSNENILFEFRTDKTLIVYGGENIAYNPGKYEYHFFKEYFGGTERITKVIINNNYEYGYGFKDGLIKLDSPDSIDLFFETK